MNAAFKDWPELIRKIFKYVRRLFTEFSLNCD